MPEINRATDPTNMIWKLVDRETGAKNNAISWAFKVGDRVKIRLEAVMNSIRNGLGMRKVGDREGPGQPENPYSNAVFI